MSERKSDTDARGAGAALVALSLIGLLNYMDRMVLAVLVEPIKRDLRLSDSDIGLVSGLAFALLYAALGLPLGRLADRRSRTVILTICRCSGA